jgi:multiple sugar transport system permease protein
MTAQAVQQPRGRWTTGQRQELLWALLFLSPWIIGFLVFTLGPMLWSLALSFTNYDPITGRADFIGTANYGRMLTDKNVGQGLFNTLYFTVLYVPLSMALGLLLASMLNRVGGRAAGFFRTVFYLPNITPAVAVGTLFLLVLANPDGILNQFLRVFGIQGPSWLNDPKWVKNGIVIMTLWSIGGTVIIYFAALRNVPSELYEAARMDGAGAWARFLHVTLPMISGALFFTFIINTVHALQLFDAVYAIFFGQRTGTPREATQFYVIWVFRQAFEFFKMGYAAALSWVLFIVVGIITFFQFRVSRRFVYYEGE